MTHDKTGKKISHEKQTGSSEITREKNHTLETSSKIMHIQIVHYVNILQNENATFLKLVAK